MREALSSIGLYNKNGQNGIPFRKEAAVVVNRVDKNNIMAYNIVADATVAVAT